jgi:hypothetical protein
MSDTLPAPPSPGIHLFADSHDVDAHEATVATALRCGATALLPCIEGQNGHRPKRDSLLRMRDLCDKRAISLLPFTFPDIFGDHSRSRGWAVAISDELGTSFILDAEPKAGTHWTPMLLKPWLACDRRMVITTTRAEAPHLGPHDRLVYAQAEQQTSIDTLDQMLAIFGRFTPLDRVIVTTGSFNQPGDPRTVDEVRRDLERCQPQALRSSAHAIWSAHTTSPEKADAVRAFALETWAAPQAA